MSETREGRVRWSEAAKAHNAAFCAALGEIARTGAEKARAGGRDRCWVAVPEGAEGVRLCESTAEEAQWLAEQLGAGEEGDIEGRAAAAAAKAVERASEARAIAVAAKAGVRMLEAAFDGSGDEDVFDHLWAAGAQGAEVDMERIEAIPVLEQVWEGGCWRGRVAQKGFEEGFSDIAAAIASREGSEGWETGMGGRQTMQWAIDEQGGWTLSEGIAVWELGEARMREVRSEPGPGGGA